MIRVIKNILTIVSVTILVVTCTDKIADNITDNLAPETNLFLYPDTGVSQQQSRIELHWWGDDPDGLVIGYYYSWDGVVWKFTPENNLLFALQIGASDTNYTFSVSAVDNSGNGKYDESVVRNGVDYGPEPFVDENENDVYDEGEKYYDIGEIDSTPASQKFPIKNSEPAIEWNELSVLPDTSFPVMTFSWNATDIDGDESIQKFNLALNDTNNFISLDGTVRLITIRTNDFTSDNPEMEVLLNGSESFISDVALPGLKYDTDNKIYIQAEDISGATSPFIALPDSGLHWYVKRPEGKLLVIDNYITADDSKQFYTEKLDSINNGQARGMYDVLDIGKNPLPFQNITFLETMKLFDGIFWYTDNNPALDLASITVQNYLNGGGKIAFSMLLPRSVDITQLQGFLPVDSTDARFITSIITGAEVVPDSNYQEYPTFKTDAPIFIVRTFYPSAQSASTIYHLISNNVQDNDIIGFKNNDNNLIFMGLPLNKMNGYGGSIVKFFDKVFIEEFGLGL